MRFDVEPLDAGRPSDELTTYGSFARPLGCRSSRPVHLRRRSRVDLGLGTVSPTVPCADARADPFRKPSRGWIIFPDGREFIKGGAAQSCIDARRVLARIQKRKLGPQLKALIGGGFLQAMIAATSDLAEALGLGKGAAPAVPSATAVADAMEKYTTRLTGYVRSLSADVDDDDEAACKAFLAAVAPIDQYRSGHTTDDSATPAPTPAVPALPANASNGAAPPA